MKTDERLKTLWDGIGPDGGAEKRMRERVAAEAEKQRGNADAKRMIGNRDPKNTAGTADAEEKAAARTVRWMRRGAAACLVLAFGMSAVLLAREAAAPLRIGYTCTLETGETLVFPPAEQAVSMSLHFDYPVVVRPLTTDESEGLFGRISAVGGEGPLANDDLVWRGGKTGGDLSGAPDFSGGIANDDLVWRWTDPESGVFIGDQSGRSDAEYIYTGTGNEQAADAPAAQTPVFSGVYGTFREDSGVLIRVEGKLAETKIAAAAPGIAVTDVGYGANGEICFLDGREVTLSSFTTRPNSRGERTAVLSASFPMTVTDGDKAAEWQVTAERAGPAEDAEAVAEALVSAVRSILSHDARIVTGGEE